MPDTMSDEEEINKKKKTKKKKKSSKKKDKEEKNQSGDGDLELAQTSPSDEKSRDVTADYGGYPMEEETEKDAMIVQATERHNSIDNFTHDMDTVIDESGRTVNISANLTPCAYSMIFVSKTCSWSFLYALFAFCFQMTIAGLTLADLVDWSRVSAEDDNAIRAPIGVPGYVRVAGYMVMMLAVVYFTDLVGDHRSCVT